MFSEIEEYPAKDNRDQQIKDLKEQVTYQKQMVTDAINNMTVYQDHVERQRRDLQRMASWIKALEDKANSEWAELTERTKLFYKLESDLGKVRKAIGDIKYKEIVDEAD